MFTKEGELQAGCVPEDNVASGAAGMLASRLLTMSPNHTPKLQARLLSEASETNVLATPMMFPLTLSLKLEEHFLLRRVNQVLVRTETIQRLNWVSIFSDLEEVPLE